MSDEMQWRAGDEKRRRTGRTTKMIKEAMRLASDGGYVFIIGATMGHCKAMLDEIQEIAGDKAEIVRGLTMKAYVYDGGQISLHPCGEQAVDLVRGRMLGAHDSCHFLVDHHTLSTVFGWVFDEWERRR